MNISPIIAHFNELYPLEKEELVILEKVFRERKFKKKQYLLQEGDISSFNSFVVSGCLRLFYSDENGKEYNLQFAIENCWINDMGSFYTNDKSGLNIEALESSIVLQINRDDQFKLFVEYPNFNRRLRIITENELVNTQQRILQNIRFNAKEKYMEFVKKYPLINNRVSNIHIASYLGITPEFLSNIRKEIFNT